MSRMKKFPKQRNPYPVIDVIVEKSDQIVVIQRSDEMYDTKFSFPGGFVEWGETVEYAAVREASEETGLKIKLKDILGVYSSPKRDRRGHIMTVVFIAVPIGGYLRSGDDAKSAKWIYITGLRPSDFGGDHGKIFSDYMQYRKYRGTFWSTK